MYATGEFITKENYPNLKGNMRSLDLIMFRGDDVISDTIAEIQEQDQFTHAGLVVNSDLLPGFNLKPNHLYVFESTYSYDVPGIETGPPDCITGNKFFGVQLRDLEKLCHMYIHNDKTKMAWFPLKFELRIENFISLFQRYHQRPFLGKEFDPIVDFAHITTDIMHKAKAIVNGPFLQAILPTSFTCVNLVLAVYQELGIIPITPMGSVIYPIDLLRLGENLAENMAENIIKPEFSVETLLTVVAPEAIAIPI
jgi:hypothetical protein